MPKYCGILRFEHASGILKTQDAGGITVISRWLSVATPPDRSQTKRLHPGGMPDLLSIAHPQQSQIIQNGQVLTVWHPSGMRQGANFVTGGVADAQPPANQCSPSGTKISRTKMLSGVVSQDAVRSGEQRCCPIRQPITLSGAPR